MENLNHLYTFYVIAQSKGLTAASQHLKITPSAVSHSLKYLEQNIGIRLMERGKNSITLTDEGKKLFSACQTMFTTYEAARDEVLTQHKKISGTLTIGAPINLGAIFLPEQTAKLSDIYPELSININIQEYASQLLSDLILYKSDIVLIDECRLENRDPRITITKGGVNHFLIAASPKYLKKAAPLKKISDFREHTYIDRNERLSTFASIKDSESYDRPQQILQMNNFTAIRNAVVAGLGIGTFPRHSIKNELKRGELIQVLPQIATGERNIIMCYLRHRENLKRLEATCDFLKASLKKDL